MNPFSILLQFLRHKLEVRRDARDQTRLQREGREELRSLFAELVESAPDEETRALAKEKRFQVVASIAASVEADVFTYLQHVPLAKLSASPLLTEGQRADSAAPLASVASKLCELRHYEEALDLVRLAEQIESATEPKVLLVKARALEGIGQADQAMATLERLMDAGWQKWEILKHQCLVLVGAGRLEEAKATAKQIVGEGEEAVGLGTLAYVEIHRGEYEAARDLIDKAGDSRPRDPNLLGVKLEIALKNDLADAAQVAEELLEVDSEDYMAHRVRATWHIQSGQADLAKVHTSRLLDLLPDQPDAHVMMARAHELAGEYDAALQQLVVAAKIDPSDFHVMWHRLGPILRKPESAFSSPDDQDLQVVSVLSAVIENPNTPQDLCATAHLLRAVYLLVEGARGLADLDFREALRLGVPKRIKEITTEHLEKITAALGRDAQSDHADQ